MFSEVSNALFLTLSEALQPSRQSQVAKFAYNVRKQDSQARSCQMRTPSHLFGTSTTGPVKQTGQEFRCTGNSICDMKQTARVLHQAHATGFSGPCPACTSCHEGSGSIHSRSQAGRSRSSTCIRKVRGIDPYDSSRTIKASEDLDVRMTLRNSLQQQRH